MTTSVQSQEETPGEGPGPDAGSPVLVSREFSQPIGAVWSALVSARGAQAWLGEGAELGGKGDPYHCLDGSSGVVRSFHPLEQLRVSWHATDAAPATVVEIDLESVGEGTRLVLRQDGPVDDVRRGQLPRHWSDGLDALAALLD